MKIICKTTYPEIEVAGFANPARPGGKWQAGDMVEVTKENEVVTSHLLQTPEWEMIPEEKKSKKIREEQYGD